MKKLILGFSLIFSVLVSAQDIHYSQFYNSPLTLNPALTGLTKGTFRAGAIYRNQWFTGVNSGFFNSPYQTPSVFVDAPLKVFKNDAVGVGGMFLYDKAGAGSFGTFQGIISGSYIKTMGMMNNHQLSAGVQVGYTQLRLKQSDLRFANQFDNNNEFDNGIASNVGLKPNVGYVNANIGLLYYGKLSKRFSLYVGGAFFNASSMKHNLETANSKRTLYYRYNAQAGADISFGKFHILPSILYMQQQTADQLNAGLGFGIDFDPKASLTLGIYTRANNIVNKDGQAESVIPYVGAEYNNFKVAASYDVTLTPFKQAGSAVGALEISVTYLFIKEPPKLTSIHWIFSPRF